MKILGIESATGASSVALVDDRRVVASASRAGRMGHERFLVPAIDFCFSQAGWEADQLDAIAVDVGPGLFTGIRVGIATAQGLAAMLGIPIMAASSLDALAVRAATRHRHIWSVVDVRRGEVAVAGYQPVPGGAVMDSPPELVSYEHLRGILASDPYDVLLVGDCGVLPPSVLRGMHRVKTGMPRYPSASALSRLVTARVERGEYGDSDIRPMYMREPDVTLGSVHRRVAGLWG
ncbi:MAG: tRNA (adenosine(37)-N6)-threonylcarbamoyltransferase complex dimerization subunit type 1 TsaB [bacterium]|nr:tRNA (adenosine(37)-N6)-threonylcarbamoyltransferase complex dimerization subunit type 1 TsaB [bacterium]